MTKCENNCGRPAGVLRLGVGRMQLCSKCYGALAWRLVKYQAAKQMQRKTLPRIPQADDMAT